MAGVLAAIKSSVTHTYTHTHRASVCASLSDNVPFALLPRLQLAITWCRATETITHAFLICVR